MEKILLFLDTSGSTHGCKNYFSDAAKIEKDLSETCEILHYEWAVDCQILDKATFDKCISKESSNKRNSGGTKISSIIPFFEKNLENVKYLICFAV